MTRCIKCDQCIQVMPRPECIVKIEGLSDRRGWAYVGLNRTMHRLDNRETLAYFINQKDCIRCNACLEVCPTDCISVQKVSLCTAKREAGLSVSPQ